MIVLITTDRVSFSTNALESHPSIGLRRNRMFCYSSFLSRRRSSTKCACHWWASCIQSLGVPATFPRLLRLDFTTIRSSAARSNQPTQCSDNYRHSMFDCTISTESCIVCTQNFLPRSPIALFDLQAWSFVRRALHLQHQRMHCRSEQETNSDRVHGSQLEILFI